MKELDIQFYKKFYKDYFQNYSDADLKTHLEKNGHEYEHFQNKNMLIDTSKFNWIFYAENNLDIENLESENDCIEHWLNEGVFENRIYGFDFNFYKQTYQDLSEVNLSNERLLLHWHLIGKNEGRICCRQNLYKIKYLEDQIKKKKIDDLNERKVTYDNLEIENGIIKNKMEKQLSELLSELLDNEHQMNEYKKDTLKGEYNLFISSLEDKNNALEKKQTLNKRKLLDEKNKNLKKKKKI